MDNEVKSNSGEVITPTAPVSSVQDANSNTTTAQPSNVPDANSKVTTPTDNVEDYKKRYEEVSKKTSVLERERNDYSKKAKQQEETINALDGVYRKNPDAYEVFRKAYKAETGVDLGDHATAYKIQPVVSTNNSQINTNNQTQNQGFDVDQITKQVSDKLKQEQDIVDMGKGAEVFLSKHPEYKTEGIIDEIELAQKKATNAKIAQFALVHRSQQPTISWNEALELGRASLPEVRSQIEQKAQLTGEKIGKATAYSAGSAVGKAPTGDNEGISASDQSLISKLTSGQKARYEEHIKKGNVAFANKYLHNALEE